MQLNITDYANWCARTWKIKDEKDTLFVCVSGFSGESGEIAEEILSGNIKNLLKEFGDFFYYWLRLNQITGQNIHTVPLPELKSIAHVGDLCLEFHKNIGRVCEILKKIVATGQSTLNCHEAIREALLACFKTFALLAQSQGYTLDQIIKANKQKIEDRIARGVLFGSGNDR